MAAAPSEPAAYYPNQKSPEEDNKRDLWLSSAGYLAQQDAYYRSPTKESPVANVLSMIDLRVVVWAVFVWLCLVAFIWLFLPPVLAHRESVLPLRPSSHDGPKRPQRRIRADEQRYRALIGKAGAAPLLIAGAISAVVTAAGGIKAYQERTTVANRQYYRDALEDTRSPDLATKIGGIWTLQQIFAAEPQLAISGVPAMAVDAVIESSAENTIGPDTIPDLRLRVATSPEIFARCNRADSLELQVLCGMQVSLARGRFPGARIPHAVLNGADLSDVNLRGADLSYAQLYGANLSRADLSGVNLTLADLSNARLSATKFCPGPNYATASLLDYAAVQAQLSNTVFRSNKAASPVWFQGANLGNALFSNVVLPGARFEGATLAGAAFRNSKLSNGRFNFVDAPNAKFLPDENSIGRSDLDGADFSDAYLVGADFTGANLAGAIFTHANLRDAKFLRADVSAEALKQAFLCHTTMPDGTIEGGLDCEKGDPFGRWREHAPDQCFDLSVPRQLVFPRYGG